MGKKTSGILILLLIFSFTISIQSSDKSKFQIDSVKSLDQNTLLEFNSKDFISSGYLLILTLKQSPSAEILKPKIIKNGKLVVSNEINFQDLRGKSLDVYDYLKQNGESGVREVQRALEYSSSNLASYHLNRLVDYGLVEKTEQNKYHLVNYIPANTQTRTDILPIMLSFLLFLSLLFSLLELSEKVWSISFVALLSTFLLSTSIPRNRYIKDS